MESNNFNIDYYTPIVESYISQNKHYFEDSKYPYGLFLPYTFGNYYKMKRKIFYMGRDAYNWMWKELMLENLNSYLNKYLDINSYKEFPELDEDGYETGIMNVNRLKYWASIHKRPGVFWQLIPHLHYYLQTGRKDLNLSNLSFEQESLLKGIGYANFNSIEVKASLSNQYDNWWPYINQESYNIIKKKSEEEIDPLRHLLNAYTIDYLIIFSWEDNFEKFIQGLSIHKDESLSDNNQIEVYRISGYPTKIIWTSHPRALHRNRICDDRIIDLIGETIQRIEM